MDGMEQYKKLEDIKSIVADQIKLVYNIEGTSVIIDPVAERLLSYLEELAEAVKDEPLSERNNFVFDSMVTTIIALDALTKMQSLVIDKLNK